MARNLCMKLPDTDKLIILDINRDTMGRLAKEVKEASYKDGSPVNAPHVEFAESARELAEKAVRHHWL